MRIFLDACVDPRAVTVFAGHEAISAFDLGWHRLKDHVLLPLVEQRFDVLVTTDQGFEYEHNLKKLRLSIVIVHVAKNKLEFYEMLARPLLEAVNAALPGMVIHVPAKD
ncbi:MAG: hypothetical protein EXQ57_03010 [Bryobacterales bacterium]|nr:hypothetical protein [Bryobacterales bacterium]